MTAACRAFGAALDRLAKLAPPPMVAYWIASPIWVATIYWPYLTKRQNSEAPHE